MKLLILGHKESGKSLIGKMIAAKLNTGWMDSSTYCLERVVYPALKDVYGYKTPLDALVDKPNRRQEWFEIIAAYNEVPDRLSLEILASHDIYVGMRNRREYEGSKYLFDNIIWVDAAGRVEPEPSTSMELSEDDAEITLDNRGRKEDLNEQIDNLLRYLGYDQISYAADLWTRPPVITQPAPWVHDT